MKRQIASISGIVLVVLTAPFTIPAIYSLVDEWRYRPTTNFQEHTWKSPDRKYRYAVIDHVAAKVVSVGLDQAEVVKRLGKPDIITPEKKWQYEAKLPGYRFIDFSGGGLLLTFNSQGRVTDISKNLWID